MLARLIARGPQTPPPPRWDPGRELRAERRARELLRAVVSAEEFESYQRFGYISIPGRGDPESGYAYLVYPHRPLVAYDTETGELLGEYCVAFPDRSDPTVGVRLPDADDVLAKWLALHGFERELIRVANMHLPGHQVDPNQARRAISCLRAWSGSRARAAG